MQIVSSITISRIVYSTTLFALALSLQERFTTAADNIPPQLAGCPVPILRPQCYGDVPPPANVTATDNVDGPLIPRFSETQTNPGSSCNNVITRIWSVTDRAGNSASCSQIIRVNDGTPSELTGCPVPFVSVQCYGDVPPPANVTASDNCLGPMIPLFSETQTNPGSSCNNVITRTWQVMDRCGNSASCSQIIRVNDTTPPDLTGCPVPVVRVECYSDVPPPANVTASDNCLGPMTPHFSETQTNPGSSCNNVITRTWQAMDRCGNSASCSQIIRVNDNTPPELTGCPVPFVGVQCYIDVPPPANVTASDNCLGPMTPHFSETQTRPGSSCDNVITRIWQVMDRCGNSASCSQIIRVNDTTPPQLFGCPTLNLTVAALPPPANVTASDDCDGILTPLFSESQNIRACNTVITRSWSAMDRCGNSASCTQTITVQGLVGDLNGDCCVDRTDLNLLLDKVRARSTDLTYDINGDGKVDIADARFLILHFTNPGGNPCASH